MQHRSTLDFIILRRFLIVPKNQQNFLYSYLLEHSSLLSEIQEVRLKNATMPLTLNNIS